jgi:hypothetical protein
MLEKPYLLPLLQQVSLPVEVEWEVAEWEAEWEEVVNFQATDSLFHEIGNLFQEIDQKEIEKAQDFLMIMSKFTLQKPNLFMNFWNAFQILVLIFGMKS